MEQRIVELEAYDALGIRTECPGGDTSSIGPLWDRLFAEVARPAGCFGAVGLSWGDGAGGFSYLAGYKVPANSNAGATLDDGLEIYSVPGGRYVAVNFDDHPSQMKASFHDIYNRINPEAGLELHPEGACIEDYPPDCHDEATGKLKCELLVRVR